MAKVRAEKALEEVTAEAVRSIAIAEAKVEAAMMKLAENTAILRAKRVEEEAAEEDAREAEVKARQVEVEARLAEVEASKAEAEARQADAEVRQAEVEVRKAEEAAVEITKATEMAVTLAKSEVEIEILREKLLKLEGNAEEGVSDVVKNLLELELPPVEEKLEEKVEEVVAAGVHELYN